LAAASHSASTERRRLLFRAGIAAAADSWTAKLDRQVNSKLGQQRSHPAKGGRGNLPNLQRCGVATKKNKQVSRAPPSTMPREPPPKYEQTRRHGF